MVAFLQRACLAKQLQWKISGVTSDPRVNQRGTPQGCAMSILAFQLVLAPAARALRKFLSDRCSFSTVVIYADDIVIMATSSDLLCATMDYAIQLLIVIGGIEIPVKQYAEVLGSTIASCSTKLAPPSSLSTASSSRSVQRWQKIKMRLTRLGKLKVPASTKRALWHSVILPVMSYDPWALLPNRSTSSAWSSLICRSLFTNVLGPKDRQLLFSANPHQLELQCILTHQLAKDSVSARGQALNWIEQVWSSIRELEAHEPRTCDRGCTAFIRDLRIPQQ
eukprot:946029-Amphidinium_carterae.1